MFSHSIIFGENICEKIFCRLKGNLLKVISFHFNLETVHDIFRKTEYFTSTAMCLGCAYK